MSDDNDMSSALFHVEASASGAPTQRRCLYLGWWIAGYLPGLVLGLALGALW